ncbi:MAG TPA: hypothetical protein DDZ91_07390 [Firmicutes bacterium]|mgnify:CR=1 FL=1|jgi:iron(III) transport system substrate-binding protein|nr:hypothetical protein [Bacillota bacterium]
MRFSKVKYFMALVLGMAILLSTPLRSYAGGYPAKVDKWLRENKVGPYQEEETDLNAIYKAALKEGPVVVYASSSRGPVALSNGFYEKWPGIEVEWNTVGTSGGIQRLITEQQSGVYNVDILFVSDFPTQANVLVPANMLFPWVPSSMRDVIQPAFQDPLLAHRYEARVIFYNDDAYSECPIDSWWDLVKPEWYKNIVLEDPRVSGSTLDLFTTLVINADQMAEEYERVFGEHIKLTTPNAGYEFIKRLAKNRPRLIDRDSEGRFVAKTGQERPPLGVSFAFSRIRDAGNPELGDLRWTVATDITPAAGLIYPSGINIAYRSKSPNGAKLVIEWLLGDENGEKGMTPWFVPGNWPSRFDVKTGSEHPYLDGYSWGINDINWWYMDSKRLWEEKINVLEFVQEHFR